MGMDNTFYKANKTDYIDDITKRYDEVVYFRKNYFLDDEISNIIDEWNWNDNAIISKEILEKLIKNLEKKLRRRKKYDPDDWHTVEILTVINKLFDFDNYYLIYEVLH